MEVQPETDGPAPPEEVAPPVDLHPPLARRSAWLLLAGAVVFLVAGALVYGWRAPDVPIVAVELGGGGQRLPLPEGTATAVWWDFALIVGYGTSLALAGLLARGVFRTERARVLAGAASWLTGVVVAADVVENVLLLSATGTGPGEQTVKVLLTIATAAAVLKFCCLVPAVVIGLVAIVVTLGRLVQHRPSRLARRPRVAVRPPDPLEGDPPAPPGAGDEAEDDASRWRRGYQVPGVDAGRQVHPVVGFCLSGGGIRSGSVALGALQSLRPELLKARYLVSVSGGGYTAGALQMALTAADERRPPTAGTVTRDPESAYMPGSVEEDRMRRHARYLADSPAEILVALGVVARVLVLSLVVLFAPALVLGAVLGEFYRAFPLAPFRDGSSLVAPQVPVATWYLLGALAGGALAAFLWSLRQNARSAKVGADRRSRRVAHAVTAVAGLVGVLAVGLPYLIHWSGLLLENSGSTSVRVGGPLLSVALTYVVTLATFVRKKKVFDAESGLFKKNGQVVGAVPGGAFQLMMVALVLILLAASWLVLAGGSASVATGPDRGRTLVTAGLVLLVLVGLGGFLDQTSLSLHPFYRRGLAGAFAARRVQRPDGHVVAEGYDFSERTRLPTYGARPEGFPEVVFAAAANLSGEKRAPLKATSFTLTAGWLGGPDVGYVCTSDLYGAVRPAFTRDLTVQAAVAISGAAFASAAGRATRWYTTLLAVTGLRLGTWLPNPAFVERWNEAAGADGDWTRPGLPRLRRLSYLLREVLGSHRFTDRLLQVTDGGHYENLGLVETLRRRCTTIYCIDASGDSPPTAGTLGEAITLAYAELGVRIVLGTEAWDLVPGSGTALDPGEPLAALNKRLSDHAVVTATICYPPESGLPESRRHGTLVLAKALLTPNLSYDLLSYAARNAVFPHDTTGDQFFDDGKFTAYSSLGRQIGHDAAVAMAAVEALGTQPCPLGSQCPSYEAAALAAAVP